MDARSLLDDLLTHKPGPAAAEAGDGIAFTCRRPTFGLLLERAGIVIPTRDVMEVLKNFQIQATDGRLRITATDMEMAMIATTELVTVTNPGTAVFPARRLQDIVREAGDGDVTVTVHNHTAQITIGRTTWRLRLETGDDYPAPPAIGDIVMAPVDRAALIEAIQTVRYAACKDPGRLSLNMIDVRAGRLVASDGARFAQAQLGEFPFDFQLPVASVGHLLKLLAKTDLSEVHIGQTQTKLIFRFGTDVFVANKLQANFPDMDATFLRPALANRHRFTVDRSELATAVRRVRINADPNTSAIALRLAPQAAALTVSARDKYGNEAVETIEVEWHGPERTIVVNHVFLADVIATHPGQTLTFHIGDDTKTKKSPVMLRDEQAGTVGVVHQMRADWVGA